ncbi:peroxidase family protein [Actinomadura sp. 6K520]|uniref:peroxidase family protein n=1 Tax=Actinomadura sp. 6K520 TaxID=2530364 RepID=UPI00104B03A6|nr:peroxidase family protein [Actinomadura sp. 6K520]TDE35690.1 hypothetical protein E1289_07410 [Actinomadura sp. 6K520]
MTTAKDPALREDVETLREEAGDRLREQIVQGVLPRRQGPLPDPALTGHGITSPLQGVPTRKEDGQTPQVSKSGYYSRMFGDLRAFTPSDDALRKLGAPCGPMDANPPEKGACLSGYAKVADGQLMKDLPSGYTYFGQFLDHNITFQADATFDPGNKPEQNPNYRSGRVSLEHVYGLGPQTQSFVYFDNDAAGKFWFDPEHPSDVPRNGEGVPIIADPRNDNTIITIQLHLAFMKFHNAVVDMLRKRQVPEKQLFSMAQHAVVWHYQWLVLHDWLEKIIQPKVFEAISKEGGHFFRPTPENPLALPVEFTVAGYRLHPLVQEEYHLNERKSGRLFHFRKPFSPIPSDEVIDWSFFFKTDQRAPQQAKRFDAKVVHTFLNIPGPIDTPIEWIDNPAEQVPLPGRPEERYTPMRSIAIRNLLRGKAFGLPSGQAVARRIQEKYGSEIIPKVYGNHDLGLEVAGLDEAPLWYYVMRESMLTEGGMRLGGVGSVIVGEVLFGLLSADPSSFVSHNSKHPREPWKPTLGQSAGKFTMADMLKLAGV